MVALPVATAVTSPELLTVETDVLSELQVTFLFVASEGKTVAVSCCVPLTGILADIGLTVTPVTRLVTVMILVAVFPPSCVVTVMVALPAAIAVTSPELLTVATDVLSELQVTVLLVASEGKMVAVSCWVPLTGILADIGLKVTPVTGLVTVSILVAVFPPS